MLRSLVSASVAAAGVAHAASASASNSTAKLETDINVISKYWGQLAPYFDNDESYFGVEDVGLPEGCGIEQAHTLQRHAQRFATSYFDDGVNDENFAGKVANWTAAGAAKFTGPLSFLNSYTYLMQEGTLTGKGAVTEFTLGSAFWNRYGRLLYDAVPGQLAYDPNYTNGTARTKPVLRTTSQSRIWNSQINWALGFFGTSFELEPNPTLEGADDPFELVVITEGGTENNTLASYDSCWNDLESPVAYLGDLDLMTHYVPLYLADATERLAAYVPDGFDWTVNDTYAMQSICAYETAYLGDSAFCKLFTLDEWAGFELTLDVEYYYDYAWGNPTGRAQGVGYLQELLARLTNKYIDVSESSVNSTLTNNPETFPLGQKFYADFSHDDIIISLLTAMSMDYFRDAPDFTTYPPNPDRRFILSHMTPFGGHLVTEVIGCSSADPATNSYHTTAYTRGANGYSAANATHKFIRMRLNDGILPLDSIRGGACAGRSDGLCALDDFLRSQENSTALANYQYACFGNWSVGMEEALSGKDWDGTIFE